jgi:tetratricopeptide (TPR) repeat protein
VSRFVLGKRGLATFAFLALAVAGPALAVEEEPSADLGGGLTFSNAPTLAEIQAQQKACEAKKTPRKANGTISEGLYKRLERNIELLAKNQYADAEKNLIELQGATHSDYEKALVLQTLGFAYASQSNKEGQAIKAFEQAIATNALPQQAHEQMMFNVAQLKVANNRFDEGIAALNGYLAETCNPVPDAHILLASVYAEKKSWREMLKQVDLAIVKAKSPKEQWLQLKLAGHYELKELPRCAEVLVALVSLAPNKEDYWKQLSGILLEIKKDPESLAVLGLAERRGYVDEEKEFRNLSNMYMYMQIPYKAAVVMQRGLDAKKVEPTDKNLETLGNAWLGAREYDKAEAAMKKAAAASDKGDLYMRLGQIQMESEKWKEALDSLQKAISKGGLRDTGETQLDAGICAIQLRQWKTAEGLLRSAMGHEKHTKAAAEWLNNLQQEVAYTEKAGGGAESEKQPATDSVEDKKDAVKAPAETKKN